MSTQYPIAFWSLENLLDTENSPRRTTKLLVYSANRLRVGHSHS